MSDVTIEEHFLKQPAEDKPYVINFKPLLVSGEEIDSVVETRTVDGDSPTKQVTPALTIVAGEINAAKNKVSNRLSAGTHNVWYRIQLDATTNLSRVHSVDYIIEVMDT